MLLGGRKALEPAKLGLLIGASPSNDDAADCGREIGWHDRDGSGEQAAAAGRCEGGGGGDDDVPASPSGRGT